MSGFTFLEMKVIESFKTAFNYSDAESEKSDNATAITANDISSFTGLDLNVVKGVIGSLTKKELIVDWNEPDMVGVSFITEKGIDAYYEI